MAKSKNIKNKNNEKTMQQEQAKQAKEQQTEKQEKVIEKQEATKNEKDQKTDKSSENSTSKEQEIKQEKQEENWQVKYNELNDKYLRLTAEFDNYRKRTLKEKMELTKSAGESILLNILPVVDNFERALKSIEEAKEIEAVKEGVQLIYNSFIEFLKQNGVKEIDALHQDFNIDEHEALTKIPAPEDKLKGKIVDVVEKGYKLHDKVIRYSKVVVGE